MSVYKRMYSSVLDHMLRLVAFEESNDVNTGLVEIYHSSRWMPICSHGFGRNEAQVACQQMGYTAGWMRNSRDRSRNSRSLWMTNVQCRGTETRLDACRHNNFGARQCPGLKPAAVTCEWVETGSHWKLRMCSAKSIHWSENILQCSMVIRPLLKWKLLTFRGHIFMSEPDTEIARRNNRVVSKRVSTLGYPDGWWINEVRVCRSQYKRGINTTFSLRLLGNEWLWTYTLTWLSTVLPTSSRCVTEHFTDWKRQDFFSYY